MGSETSNEQTEHKNDEQIPQQYLCPLTNKIMCNPMMTLTTGNVYDCVSIQKWIESGQNVDPTNGIPLCIQQSKDAAFEFRQDLKNEIDEYLQSNPQYKVLQSLDDINWKQIFEQKIEHISWLKSEYKRLQKQMTKQAQILFSAQRVTPGKNDDDLKFNNPIHNIDFHDVPLRNDIPIITFIGPSRYGKSTLLNDILRENAFKVSSSPNEQCTKGAWIACYKSQNKNMSDDGAPHVISDDDIIAVPTSITKGVIKHDIVNREYDKKTVDQLERFGYSRRQIITAMDIIEDKEDINGIIDFMTQLEEEEEMKSEIHNTQHSHSLSSFLQTNFVTDTRQLYLVDMEGLSHGVTPFTKKLFYACYAISNVIVWNDKQIGSDGFKIFMKDLAKDMKCVVHSERKPCLLYLQRDSDECLDFGEYDSFDGYIGAHESFKWLRDLNIFGSVHGFQLYQRRYNDGFDDDIISKFVEFLVNLTFLSSRFVENAYDMKQQIDCINERNTINLGLELVFANDTLRGLLMNKGNGNDANIRRSQIIQYAEKYKWDKTKIEEEFKREDEGLLTQLSKQGLIDEDLRMEIIGNKNDVIQTINQKNTDDIIKIALIVTSPITVPLAIIVGLASAVVIIPYLAGSAIYDKWIITNEDDIDAD